MSKTSWIIISILLIVVLGYNFFMRPAQAPSETLPTIPTGAQNDITVAEPTQTIPAISEPVPTTSNENKPQGEATPLPPASSQVKEVRVEASEFKFSPASITLAPGQSVRLTLVNTGNMGHDLDIDGIVDGPIIAAGDQTIITFTAPQKAGNYPYYCSVGSHRSLGMEGQLIVK